MRVSGSETRSIDERAPEPIDVRLLPRLPRDEVFGDDARFGGLIGARYASVSCACASYIVVSRPPSTQTSTSLSSAGIWRGTRGHELLQDRLRRPELRPRRLRRRPPRRCTRTSARARVRQTTTRARPRRPTPATVGGKQLARAGLARGSSSPAPQLDLGERAAAGSGPRPRCPRRGTRVRPPDRPCPSAACRERRSRPRVRADCMRTNSLSASIASAVRPFSSRSSWSALNRVAAPPPRRPISSRVRAAVSRASKSDGSIVPSADDDFGRAAAIALRAAPGGDGVQMTILASASSPCRAEMSASWSLRRLVVLGLELEDLLVERGRLRVEALVDEVLGDAGVLRDGLLRLPRPRVQLAERVRRAPVAWITLRPRVRIRRSPASRRPWRRSFSAFFSVASRSRANGILHGPETRGAA